MLDIISIYDDVATDNANKDENGYLSYEKFNRMSRRAELRLIDYLSGDVENLKAPMPWLSQKNKDWLSPFIKRYDGHVEGGSIARPADYYGYENMYRIGSEVITDCDEEGETDTAATSDCNTVIELLDGQKFYNRCNTYITGLKPSMSKPIAKQVGKSFVCNPADLGSIALEYIRYPVFGEIKTKVDTVYNDVVPDTLLSTHYEWDENSREALVWFITDTFANHISNKAMKEFNNATGKSVRG